MKKVNKSYWVLIAVGAMLLAVQFIATMSSRHLADDHLLYRDAANRMLTEVRLAQVRARQYFSTPAVSREDCLFWKHLDTAQAQASLILNGDSEKNPPWRAIRDRKGRQLTKKVREELSDLRQHLQTCYNRNDPVYQWTSDSEMMFQGTFDASAALLPHLYNESLSNHDLHERLEIATLVMIALALVAGFVIIRRNDHTQSELMKKIATDEKDLRTTLNSITDGVIATDSNRCVTRMNAVAERLTGRSMEDAHGLQVEEVFKLAGERAKRRLSTQVIQSINANAQSSISDSGNLQSKGGEIHPIEFRTSQIHDEGGKPLGAVLVFRQVDSELELRRRLEDQETRYKAIVDSSPIGMYVYELTEDDQLVMRAANPAANELVGADQSSNVGKTIEEAFPPLRETQIPGAYRQVALTGQTWSSDQVTYEDEHISGAFEVRAFQIAPNWMVAAFSNITQRKQAEEQLASSEARFRNLFETMEQGIVYQSTDGRILQANPAALRILGVDADTLCGMSAYSPEWKIIGENGEPLGRDDHPATIALQTKEPVTDVLVGLFNQAQKSYHWLSVTAIPEFKKGNDEPYQVYTMFHDVTARRHALTELQRLRNLLANIINSMPSILIGVDTNCSVTHWNRRAETVTGVNVNDALGRKPSDVYAPFEAYVQKAAYAMERREVVEESHTFSESSGKIRHEDVTIYPLASQHVEGAVIRIDDVTEQRQLVEQLRQSQKMDAVGQLAGGVAHDFNNMLAGILGAAELLQEEAKDGQKKFVDIIVDSAERAAELTKKLLTFSRKGRVESRAIDVHDAIRASAALLEHTLDKRIVIETKLDAATHVVDGDAGQLQNAFINMGINAGHAMREGGTLTFATRVITLSTNDCAGNAFALTPGAYLEIDVQDTGCGMSAQVAGRIFEPFFTTRPLGEGTGLGLSAVYGTVQQHHGSISVNSEPDVGTTFKLWLPLSHRSPPDEDDRQTTQKPGRGRILVVDDEEVIRTTVQAILENQGFSVILADDGHTALDLYKAEGDSIDLVLLDMLMPEMDGKTAFGALKEVDPDVKVIVSSGFSPDTSVRDMLRDGMVDFITKPFRAAELTDMVKRHLSQK